MEKFLSVRFYRSSRRYERSLYQIKINYPYNTVYKENMEKVGNGNNEIAS